MRNFSILAVALLASTSALAIPTPGAFSQAEIKALLAHKTIEGWVIKKLEVGSYDEKAKGNNYSLVLLTGGSLDDFCLTAVVASKMAEPEGDSKSSDEAVGTVKRIGKIARCKAE